jgi:Esterase PHB depolymerase
VFDVDPTTGAVKSANDSIFVASGTQAAPPIPRTSEKFRGFLDQINGTTGKFLHPTERTGAPVPSGARFEEGIHVSAHGSRTYKLYVPSGLHAGQPVPLIIMLHGCTQSPDDFAAGTRMNTLARSKSSWSPIRPSLRPPTPRSAGIGLAPVIRSGIAESPH